MSTPNGVKMFRVRCLPGDVGFGILIYLLCEHLENRKIGENGLQARQGAGLGR